MGWIDDRRQSSQDSHQQQDAGTQFAAAARSRWQALGDELRADVAEFNKQGTGADLAVEGEDHIASVTPGLDWNWCSRLISRTTPQAMTMLPLTSRARVFLRVACFRCASRAAETWSFIPPMNGLRQKKPGRCCWSRCYFPSSHQQRSFILSGITHCRHSTRQKALPANALHSLVWPFRACRS